MSGLARASTALRRAARGGARRGQSVMFRIGRGHRWLVLYGRVGDDQSLDQLRAAFGEEGGEGAAHRMAEDRRRGQVQDVEPGGGVGHVLLGGEGRQPVRGHRAAHRLDPVRRWHRAEPRRGHRQPRGHRRPGRLGAVRPRRARPGRVRRLRMELRRRRRGARARGRQCRRHCAPAGRDLHDHQHSPQARPEAGPDPSPGPHPPGPLPDAGLGGAWLGAGALLLVAAGAWLVFRVRRSARG